MPHEDLKIIIKKNGEIWVDVGGLEPYRIKHYRELFEEAIGPIIGELTSADGGGSPGRVHFAGYLSLEDEEEKRERIKKGS